MDKKKLRRAPLFVAAAAVLPIALGACSSSSSTSNTASSSNGSSSSAQTGQAQFSQCMRQNGVTNFPDPTNGHLLMQPGVQSNPNFRSAMQTCQHYLGPGGISNGGGQNTAAMLSFAHCMQTHGVPSFPDPTGNGEIMAPKGVDKNSPTYQNAFNTCKSKLPGGGSGFAG